VIYNPICELIPPAFEASEMIALSLALGDADHDKLVDVVEDFAQTRVLLPRGSGISSHHGEAIRHIENEGGGTALDQLPGTAGTRSHRALGSLLCG